MCVSFTNTSLLFPLPCKGNCQTVQTTGGSTRRSPWEKWGLWNVNNVLTPVYAFTDYKVQCKVKRWMWISGGLGETFIGRSDPVQRIWREVEKSGRNTIRLLHKFNEKLFIQNPHDKLRKEDTRLATLEHLQDEAGGFRIFTNKAPKPYNYELSTYQPTRLSPVQILFSFIPPQINNIRV